MASAGQDVPISPLLDFTAGTMGGMVGLAVGFPFDTIKVRLQHPETMTRYRNSVQALFKIVREERVAGLFKGISSPMAGCAFLNGLVFASTGYLIQAQLPDASTKPTLTQITLAGAGTGIIGAFIATPTELIKIRQQANTSSGKQPSAWSVAKALYEGHGMRGLYRGFWSTAGRDMSYGAYFATYEGMRRLLTTRSPDGEEKPLGWGRLMVAGGVAGVAGWIFTFHLDSIKTRVQSVDYAPPRYHPLPSLSPSPALTPSFALARAYSNSAPAVSPYRTTWSTTMYMYRTEGLRSFWKGLWPTIVRAVPVNMATFGAYELVVGIAR
ncbi:mitochondrial carrier protein [Ceratobasidium sp. AG-Ba]|nr:mitochondrial carrier protein [Ceratobasidium sp. AG-Ba]QRW02600.1 mitochondrial carrier protein [Ceratobasidium sp. AG-Ba]